MSAQVIFLTLKLASITTMLLLVLSTPLAWWLSRSNTWYKAIIESVVALPLILPPTVIGFYLLIMFNPNHPIGRLWQDITGSPLIFSFNGLVIGSMIYSLPFVVQPLKLAFGAVHPRYLEASAMLGASPIQSMKRIIFPLAKSGYLTALILGFAHTIGEFGVVLMIGGNIPGQTQVLSMALYDEVEQLHYYNAHLYAGMMVITAIILLSLISYLNQKTHVAT